MSGGEADDSERCPPLPQALPSLGEERRQHDDQSDLAELRGLEVEEADLDPALRAAHLFGDRQHRHEQDERDSVERPASPPVRMRVDDGRRRQQDDPDDDVDDLAKDVVAGSPGTSFCVTDSSTQSP